jgi:ribosome-associated heat shock protein Hsp15
VSHNDVLPSPDDGRLILTIVCWPARAMPARAMPARAMMEDIETARIDQWLWAVRLCSTRANAADACRGGHVRVNGKVAKPATAVRMGDHVEALVGRRQRVVEVSEVITKRVSAPLAAECFVDHSPPPPPPGEHTPVFRRDPGAGRPTKRDRRRLDQLRGRLH